MKGEGRQRANIGPMRPWGGTKQQIFGHKQTLRRKQKPHRRQLKNQGGVKKKKKNRKFSIKEAWKTGSWGGRTFQNIGKIRGSKKTKPIKPLRPAEGEKKNANNRLFLERDTKATRGKKRKGGQEKTMFG